MAIFLKDDTITFDDIRIVPGFSDIVSRKDVDIRSNLNGIVLNLPVMSSPMDTVTTPEMSKTMFSRGGIGILHRFNLIDENIKEFRESKPSIPIVSVGLNDWERIDALHNERAYAFLLDVAHGAQQTVVNFVRQFRQKYKNEWLMVGNFATGHQISEFIMRAGVTGVDMYRVGIGPGSACETVVKTGCGLPALSSVMSCVEVTRNIVCDGGIAKPGDFAKAIAAGAKAVMVGGLLAGTDETPWFDDEGKKYSDLSKETHLVKLHKRYRGSASQESYDVQNKKGSYLTSEGASFKIKHKGPAQHVLTDMEGGLRSAMTYVGAKDVKEFQEKARFAKASNSSAIEATSHYRNRIQ